MSTNTRRIFTPGFKTLVASMVIPFDRSRSYGRVAQLFGITMQLLRMWRAALLAKGAAAFPGKGVGGLAGARRHRAVRAMCDAYRASAHSHSSTYSLEGIMFDVYDALQGMGK